jgi:hypothetical protein
VFTSRWLVEKNELTKQEKEYKSKRKVVQEKLIKFCDAHSSFHVSDGFSRQYIAARDHHAGTGPVSCRHRFDRGRIPPPGAPQGLQNRADESGIERHAGLTRYGLYDTVVARAYGWGGLLDHSACPVILVPVAIGRGPPQADRNLQNTG